ncbi:MAG: hypothetical protein HOP33_06665 [Verrucomicrobia bacterium]|nr:hypothetical protein [Verrucomicrobiota bacterium]
MGHVKLHIPGPVEVSEKNYSAFCAPMIGHRGQGYKDIVAPGMLVNAPVMSAGL